MEGKKCFKKRLDDIRDELVSAFVVLANKYGERDRGVVELFTFDACTEEGLMLNDSTIDKIEVYANHVNFYYDSQTNDYDSMSSFSIDELTEFYDGLKAYMEGRGSDNPDSPRSN